MFTFQQIFEHFPCIYRLLSLQAQLQGWEVRAWQGWSWVCPRALFLQAHANLPADRQAALTPHQLRIQEWRRAPPQQQPCALPAAVTILTLDLLTSPEVVEVHQKILTEVGVGVLFWVQGPWYFCY